MTIFAARSRIVFCAETRDEQRRDQPRDEEANLMASVWKAVFFEESVCNQVMLLFVVMMDRELKEGGHSNEQSLLD